MLFINTREDFSPGIKLQHKENMFLTCNHILCQQFALTSYNICEMNLARYWCKSPVDKSAELWLKKVNYICHYQNSTGDVKLTSRSSYKKQASMLQMPLCLKSINCLAKTNRIVKLFPDHKSGEKGSLVGLVTLGSVRQVHKCCWQIWAIAVCMVSEVEINCRV